MIVLIPPYSWGPIVRNPIRLISDGTLIAVSSCLNESLILFQNARRPVFEAGQKTLRSNSRSLLCAELEVNNFAKPGLEQPTKDSSVSHYTYGQLKYLYWYSVVISATSWWGRVGGMLIGRTRVRKENRWSCLPGWKKFPNYCRLRIEPTLSWFGASLRVPIHHPKTARSPNQFGRVAALRSLTSSSSIVFSVGVIVWAV